MTRTPPRAISSALVAAATCVWSFAACSTDDGGASPDVAAEITADAVADAAADAPLEVEVDGAAPDADADVVEPPPSPAWYENAVMYEVFVRSFQDSDGDGIGDLQGLIARLDYLNDGVPGAGDDLEVDGIWLMPIFAAHSYHGYDTLDYRAIDPAYGTDADLEALVAACDARGMRVVLDLVMNHTSRHHPWFEDASAGPDAAKRSWYVWREDDPGWMRPFAPHGGVWHELGGAYYYGLFWVGMPDLNFREPAVVAELTDVATHWLDFGVAGFRLDAARFLVEGADGALAEQPETHAFWKQLRADLEAHTPGAYLVGEVWSGRTEFSTYWGDGEELPQAFDFSLYLAIEQAITKGAATWLRSALAQQALAGVPWSFEATFLTNHDLERLAFRLGAGGLRPAAVILLTLPGTPYLYYGQEIGMQHAAVVGDEAKRAPLAWDATATGGFTTGTPWNPLPGETDTHNVAVQLGDPDSLLSLYRELIRLRRAHPALGGDGLEFLTPAAPSLYAALRHDDDGAYLVAVHLGKEPLEAVALDLSEHAEILGPGPWTPTALLGGEEALDPVEDLASVPTGPAWSPREARILRLR